MTDDVWILERAIVSVTKMMFKCVYHVMMKQDNNVEWKGEPKTYGIAGGEHNKRKLSLTVIVQTRARLVVPDSKPNKWFLIESLGTFDF